jgi:hypothetical protein
VAQRTTAEGFWVAQRFQRCVHKATNLTALAAEDGKPYTKKLGVKSGSRIRAASNTAS